MTSYDMVIVGAGMAGASIAAELAADMSVLLVEMEDQPGYHATGRSVAFWVESYGGPDIAPLTAASGPLLEQPPGDLSAEGFLTPRGSLHIGRAEDAGVRDALIAEFSGRDLFRPVAAEELQRRITGLRPDWVLGLEEPNTRDIDVARLHASYLSAFARRGGRLARRTELQGAARQAGGGWRLSLTSGEVSAGLLVNAAGAWADTVARVCGVAPLGIAPFLRTVVQLRVDPPVRDDLPVVIDLNENFYFKPCGGGRIWLSPHDEKPSPPGDVVPEELDVAIAIDRLQQAVGWRVEAVERKWAGLRSFAPDRRPVYGRDPACPDFFWFAGQGGFGIQTAPAAARLGRWLIAGGDPDPALTGIDAAFYGPARFT
ncbi:MAG: NAD(P)/FAD-dependent oxidoreductase [Sphingobium sp.]